MRPKSWKQIFLVSGLLLSLIPHQGFAVELAPQGTAERKFQRGLINTFFAPVELSSALADDRAQGEQLVPAWIGNGVFRGLYFTTLRAFSGLWDILTFPFPRPVEYKPLLRHKEFALQHLDPPSPQKESAPKL